MVVGITESKSLLELLSRKSVQLENRCITEGGWFLNFNGLTNFSGLLTQFVQQILCSV